MRYIKPHVSIIHYLAIAVAILTVCSLANANPINTADPTTRSDIINVDLYYAPRCGDSVRFVNNQLVPAYEEIGSYINVTYIPYGKATHELIANENGTQVWNFTCQHGPEGCYGNKAHACAINEILKKPAISNEQQVLLDFLSCAMLATNPARAVPECLAEIGIDANYISRVNTCIESIEGDELLAGYGDTTDALVPTLTFVPTIVINGVFSQENQDNSLVDFQGVIRQYITTDSSNGAEQILGESASPWVLIFSFLRYLYSQK